LLQRLLSFIAFVSISQAAYAQVQPDSLILIDSFSIYYASDAYEIEEAYEQELSSFFNFQNTRELEFHIDAYTDTDGDEEYNIALSNRRSEAIVNWLKYFGVGDRQIIRVSHGEQYASIVASASVEDKNKDRRSEIRVFQKAAYKLFKGQVMFSDEDDKVGLEITIDDSGIKRKVRIDTGSRFLIPIPINRNVELQFKAKDYFPIIKTLKLSPTSRVGNVKQPITKMKRGAVALLHLQFVPGRSSILPEYRNTIPVLFSALQKSPHICLELAGHIHFPGDIIKNKESESFGLSIARSIVVHNQLLRLGISKNRLLARGYGNSRMKFPSPMNNYEKSANRRVEAIVMSCDSTRLLKNHFVDHLRGYDYSGPPIKF